MAAKPNPTVADVERLIALVERKLDEAGPAPDYYTHGRQVWEDHQAAGTAIVRHLVEAEGASYRAGVSDGYRLKLAGVATSCTGGNYGLLRNWINAARRLLTAVIDDDAAAHGEVQ